MYRRMILSWFALLLLSLGILIPGPARGAAQAGAPEVVVLTSQGALNPSMKEYLQRGIRAAEDRGAEALVFRLNTPGGGLMLMNEMVAIIRASQVPVVVYVYPRAAMAASAGTLITLAGHASAMAPETIIGAASPVDATGADLDQTMQAKEKNALKATIDTLASRRPAQAVELAKEMVDQARAVSAQEAADVGLVDFIATDTQDLLTKLDGFSVEINGGTRTLHTANAVVEEMEPSLLERVLGTLTDPNVVALLLNIGVIAILIELSSPGGWVAGFIGVVCLALAVYGFGILPVNWFGLIFLILAFALFILDIKAPTHGALTAAGVGSLIVGGLVLFNTPSVPSFAHVSVPVVVISALVTGLLFFGVMLVGVRAQKVPVRTGWESLVGRFGTVSVPLNPRGQVRVNGELWSAELRDGAEVVERGARVRVLQVNGLTLIVEKAA